MVLHAQPCSGWACVARKMLTVDFDLLTVQGPNSSSSSQDANSSSSLSPPTKGQGKAAKQKHKQQQQQQRSAEAGDSSSSTAASWRALSELLARKNDRINHLQVTD